MKYKLKFEVVYPNDLDKQDLRDLKIDVIFDNKDDIISELESDEPIGSGISVNTRIVLGGVDHVVSEIAFGIEKDCFVTIFRVVNNVIQKRAFEINKEKELSAMRSNITRSWATNAGINF